VQLARPEVSVEARRWTYSTPFTEGGRLEGLPSGLGIDTTVGLRTARSEADLSGLSFVSVAYPKGRWSVAFFRHELANFEFFGETQGLFGGGTDCCQTVFFNQRMTTDLEVVSHGLSAAYRVSESFDVGFGATYHETSLTARATMFLADDDSVESLFAPNSYLPERSLVARTLLGGGTDWGLTGGFLWRPAANWRIGGVYRQGPESELVAELTAGEAGDFGVPAGGLIERVSGFSVELPGLLGLGFAYRTPDGGLTVSFQWDRVDYSRIVESLGLRDEVVDDVQELHLGGEYVFLHATPIIAARIGAWLDPDHQIRSVSEEPLIRALQPPGEDEVHYAAGLGVAFAAFQLDLAADIADGVDTVSLSAIYSF
jgi:hypothetical protein